MDFTWIDDKIVEAVHDAQLAEHGGLSGVRDAGLLASALARRRNLAAYGDPDVAQCAAAYGFGLARNHPFIDGNKRTAYVLVEVFVERNGYTLTATDADAVLTMLGVADGSIGEQRFATWIRKHLERHR